jgi:hypothetical protein
MFSPLPSSFICENHIYLETWHTQINSLQWRNFFLCFPYLGQTPFYRYLQFWVLLAPCGLVFLPEINFWKFKFNLNALGFYKFSLDYSLDFMLKMNWKRRFRQRTASIIRAMMHDWGTTHLSNVGLLLQDYTALYPRKLSDSLFLCSWLQIILILILLHFKT